MTELDTTAKEAFEAMAEAHDLKMWERCAELGDAWLEARGELPALACVWYGQALMATMRLQEALHWTAIAAHGLKDSDPVAQVSAYSNYGQALCRAGLFTKARRVMSKMTSVVLPPGEGQEKQGHVFLALSDKWAKGWGMTEGRLLSPGRGLPENCRPWDGTTNEPVSVLHEQGIGDAILAARWVAQLATLMPVTWYGPSLLHGWIGAIDGIRVGSLEDAASKDLGATCRAMSLPSLLGVRRPSDVVGPVAPTDLLERRKWHRPRSGHLNVGVCWRGSAGGWHDFERSLPIEEFAPIFAPLDGVNFVNLCHGESVPAGSPFDAVKFSDVMESGRAIAALDLVVSVDTAVVHLAGSLGVPTMAIVPTVPDWRYKWPHGGTTPFYPSVTVLRKQHMLDVDVVKKARTLLERFAAHLNQRVA